MNKSLTTQSKVLAILASGITQCELAKMIKCSQPTIATYAAGTRGENISMRFGVALDEVYKKQCKGKRK